MTAEEQTPRLLSPEEQRAFGGETEAEDPYHLFYTEVSPDEWAAWDAETQADVMRQYEVDANPLKVAGYAMSSTLLELLSYAGDGAEVVINAIDEHEEGPNPVTGGMGDDLRAASGDMKRKAQEHLPASGQKTFALDFAAEMAPYGVIIARIPYDILYMAVSGEGAQLLEWLQTETTLTSREMQRIADYVEELEEDELEDFFDHLQRLEDEGIEVPEIPDATQEERPMPRLLSVEEQEELNAEVDI